VENELELISRKRVISPTQLQMSKKMTIQLVDAKAGMTRSSLKMVYPLPVTVIEFGTEPLTQCEKQQTLTATKAISSNCRFRPFEAALTKLLRFIMAKGEC